MSDGSLVTKSIVQRGWTFISDEGDVDVDFFETTKPIPAWDWLKPIRATRTVTYEIPKKRKVKR